LTLKNFAFLRPNTSRSAYIKRLGKPDRELGSGLCIDQYQLADGTSMIIGGTGSSIDYVLQEDHNGKVIGTLIKDGELTTRK
jgi:hypothetical protein